MFDETRLREVLELQRRSYALLRWANHAAKERRLKFSELHGNMSTVEAARSWIGRNLSSLPPEARPSPEQVEEFAHLFASYLATSFEVAQRLRVSDGCPCDFCTILVDVPHLKARIPDRRDHHLARKLKLITLEKLALGLDLPLLPGELERILGANPEIERDVALVTWAIELLRRGEFRGQGAPVLALWREIAWKDKRPDPKFEVTVERVLAAEARIREVLLKSSLELPSS